MKNEMMKNLICLVIAFTGSVGCAQGSASGKSNGVSALATSSGMPVLHKIQSYAFQAPYGCNGSYEKSALFLSEFSKQRNSPDLLFTGACGSQLYIEASTASDDFALVSDLGNVPLETVSASKSFNYDRVVGRDNTFKQSMPVSIGHTYVVLISKSDIRALWVLHVDNIGPNGQMKISYAVKSYSVQATQSESPGFDWEQGNK